MLANLILFIWLDSSYLEFIQNPVYESFCFSEYALIFSMVPTVGLSSLQVAL